MYHSVANAVIVVIASLMLWAAFFIAVTTCFGTDISRYVSPVMIGVLSASVGGYLEPSAPKVTRRTQLVLAFIAGFAFAVLVGWQADASWQRVAGVAAAAGLVFAPTFVATSRALRPWLLRNARRIA
jgi:hypothetical protein